MKLRFNDRGEFIKEVTTRPPVDLMVRVTQRYTSSEQLPLQRVHVVATYYRETPSGQPYVVMLERYCGDAWPEHHPNPAIVTAEKLVQALLEQLIELGFTVAAGVLES